MSNVEVISQAKHITALCDWAKDIFPLMCYYEGGRGPDDVNYDKAADDQWSEDNPVLPVWRRMESDLARMTDYVQALLMGEGINVPEMFDIPEDAVVFDKGTLSRMVATQFRNAQRESKMDSLLERLSKQK